MKQKNIYPSVGMLIYIVLAFIDRILIDIPDYIYISLGLIAIVLIIIGIIKDRKK